jgi:hypothetical protein
MTGLAANAFPQVCAGPSIVDNKTADIPTLIEIKKLVGNREFKGLRIAIICFFLKSVSVL